MRMPLIIVVVSVLASPLWLSQTTSVAGVIYEFRELDSNRVIGTWEIAAPPASASSGWSTRDASDLIALFLPSASFGLGSFGNLLTAGGRLSFSLVQSLAGPTLDAGGLGIVFPTRVDTGSRFPGNPTIDQSLSISLEMPGGFGGGVDLISIGTVFRFPDGSVLIGDQFIGGDWVARGAEVHEPSALAMLGLGLLALRQIRRRWA